MASAKEIKKIQELLESANEDLKVVENYIEENGCLDDGITDASNSFEQGYVNALEQVLKILCSSNQPKVTKVEKIICKCYGKEQTFDSREKATKFYEECMMMSEGHERQRYGNILLDLLNGETYCDDRDGD